MAKKSSNSGEMSFLEHLEELRWHIVRSAIAIFVCSIAAFIFNKFIFRELLEAPMHTEFFTNRIFCRMAEIFNKPDLCINTIPWKLQSIKPTAQFNASIMISLYTGFVVAFPFMIRELWLFIAPALYENERKHARGSVLWISVLFFIGALFGYYMIVPLTIHFFGSWHVSETVENIIALEYYVSHISYIPFATGLIFELPILMVFLTKVGLITPSFLIKYRRHAIIILMVLAAVITPPDVISMILVTLPLVLLYEVSIILTKRTAKKYQEAMSK